MDRSARLWMLTTAAASVLLLALVAADGSRPSAQVPLPAPVSASAAAAAAGSPPPPPVPVPPFEGRARQLTAMEKHWMTGQTWHPGCPVPLRQLRLLTVSFHDFDDAVDSGRVVVHRKVAADIIALFEQLYKDRFPIKYLDAVELYPPGERRHELGNVSVAFNCRTISGSAAWSQHAYGLALDLNPAQNPLVNDDGVIPPAGEEYVDRTQDRPGMIHKGDSTVQAFTDIGWGWGGDWRTFRDDMHFSLTGG